MVVLGIVVLGVVVVAFPPQEQRYRPPPYDRTRGREPSLRGTILAPLAVLFAAAAVVAALALGSVHAAAVAAAWAVAVAVLAEATILRP